MKHYMRIPIILTLLALVFALARPLAADNFGAGMSAWISWWNPYFTEGGAHRSTQMHRSELNPSVQFGPALTWQFLDHWDISLGFKYGSYKSTWNDFLVFPSFVLLTGGPAYCQSTRSVSRYDLNAEAGYLLNRYLKVYGGVKYFGYEIYDSMSVLSNYSGQILPLNSRYVTTNHNTGPMLGVGGIIPLWQDFYFLPKFTAMTLFGRLKGKVNLGSVQSSTLMHYGFSFHAPIAYVMSGIQTTFNLGYKIQYLRIKKIGGGYTSANTRDDIIQGVTLSAIFAFDI